MCSWSANVRESLWDVFHFIFRVIVAIPSNASVSHIAALLICFIRYVSSISLGICISDRFTLNNLELQTIFCPLYSSKLQVLFYRQKLSSGINTSTKISTIAFSATKALPTSSPIPTTLFRSRHTVLLHQGLPHLLFDIFSSLSTYMASILAFRSNGSVVRTSPFIWSSVSLAHTFT